MEKKYGEMFQPKEQTGERKEDEKQHEKNEPASVEKKEQRPKGY